MAKTKNKEQIEIKVNYGTGVTVLPDAVLSHIDKAKKFDLKVLMLIASGDKYRQQQPKEQIAARLGCSEADVENALSFWRGAGIISVEDGASSTKHETQGKANSPEAPANAPKRAKASELPQYTSKELNAFLEKNNSVIGLIDECQNILGKIFTAADIKVLVGLVDYLGLDNDYILVLMHYCARKEIKAMRYIEKMAVSCLDEGFVEAAVLEEALYTKDEKTEFEGRIKAIFGIGTRKLTTKEQKQVDTWKAEFKFEMAVIEKAYDITVNATSKPSIHYANAILEKWYAEGARTVEDVDKIINAREEAKAIEGKSFDVEDFFDAALKRSYSEK